MTWISAANTDPGGANVGLARRTGVKCTTDARAVPTAARAFLRLRRSGQGGSYVSHGRDVR